MIIKNVYAFSGTSNDGVWRRPLINMFGLNVEPDTLLLSQFSGMKDTLFIHSSLDWMVIGFAPDWMTFEPASGDGDGIVVFTTLTSNLAAIQKEASFFLYSPTTGATIMFTVFQKEKSAGLDHLNPRWITVFPNPSTGMMKIESVRPVKKLTILNALGKTILAISNTNPGIFVDLTKEDAGVYFVRLEGDNWASVKKIVILH
jgi:hypothetical protein